MQNETFFYIDSNPNSIFLNMKYFGIWNILEDGIFWNMEYFGIWNILEYGIFFNMEYGIFQNETLSYNSQNLSYIFWNMEYFRIWNIF